MLGYCVTTASLSGYNRVLDLREFHLRALRGVQVRTEAGAAAGLIHAGSAHDDQLPAFAEALRVDGRSAADHADCRELGHLVGDGHERRDGSEWISGEGGVQPGHDDAL